MRVEDLRPLPFAERRPRLEALVRRLDHARIDLSPLVPFATWDEVATTLGAKLANHLSPR